MPSSLHPGNLIEFGQCLEVDLREGFHERPHVREEVLPGSVDKRRHQVWQDGAGTLPAEQVEQLERLLRIDRAVPVREVVRADDAGEPRPQILGAEPSFDRAEHERLRLSDLLGLDEPAERGGTVRRDRARRSR